MVLATVGQAGGVFVGRRVRNIVGIGPLRALDNMGGLVLGVISGLAFCWAIGAVLLYVPGQTELRRYAQESAILSALNSELPPETVMDALSRVDSFAAFAGPSANVDPPDPGILEDPDVAIAKESVVRVTGLACGLGVEGSGWVAAPGLVVTNAHVVAGIVRPVVDQRDGRAFEGRVIAFDATNDVAIVHVPGLRALALEIGVAQKGTAAAMLGFPENGAYTATPVRVGSTHPLVGRDAYGRFPTTRQATAIRGSIRNGNSGGPVVDAAGRVVTTVFGERSGSGDPGGYGVPTTFVQQALVAATAGRPLSTPCVER
jgi:S1-C subfamily serine protease